ncbi:MULTISPECIES: hypothetical protein [Enterococcus]|uniref:hypothetical protein n=1 Tax=Enterococcus TaxID=1350 RepID=UPI0001CEB6C3|nr:MULTISPECIES: hypothetical protein [Enterococcus]EFF25724.1 conserved hypothetical protein [Enterococcus faecium E1679]ELB18097.1 hypothetical protein OIS_05135 [Enterococcus faecium EnGen0035]EOF90947.1 hypothetical protein SK5_00454 [Enterococcus faecium EnGen0161]MCV3177573.1 hypothetical protein [Enterococcus faecium]MCV3182624.1 hypothetical protein [Enterococcus faecium]
MNGLKEFFGNIPMFQKQVEREIEEKGIEPSEGIKKMEFSRQVIRNVVIGVLVVGILAFVGISYFNNKNQPPVTPTATTESKESNQSETSGEATENSSQAVQGSSDHLLKLSAKERADEATEAFESWYTSFSNGDGILEINKELLKEGSGGTSPIELQTKLIDNLKAKFGDKVSDDFYTSLQTSFNFNPVIVDGTKGLTISKQNDDDSQWLNTWFLDTEKTEQNTKIVLRNDFPFEWVDWRNDARHREAYKNIFTQLDWDNDLSYEVVGINLTESKKNVEGVSIAFVIMKYNEKLGKWQVTGSIGGII